MLKNITFLFLFFFINTNVNSENWEHLFDDPIYQDVKISPDGKFLAVKALVKKKLCLIFLDSKKNEIIHIVRPAGQREVGDYYWVNNERVVMGIDYRKPWIKELQSYGELFAINFDGKKSELIYGVNNGETQTGTRLKKKKQVYGWAEIIDILPGDHKNILISSTPMSDGGERLDTIYKLNVYTGKFTRKIAKSPISYASYVTDVNGELKVASGIDSKNNPQVYFRKKGAWVKISESAFGTSFTPLTISKSGKYLYTLDNFNQDKTGLFKINLETAEYKHIFTDENVDVTYVSRTTDNRNIYAIRVDDGLPAYLLINKKLAEAKVFKKLTSVFPGQKIDIRSHTEKGDKYIVKISSDVDPGSFYLYDKQENQLSFIFKYYPELDSEKLQVTESFSFISSDDKLIKGYFTQAKISQQSIAPLVVLVHGGPHARDYWAYSSQVQYLAQNGFSVLQVNFRGSTGYGEEFKKLGYKNWGSTIQQDIFESTQWAVNNKKADKDNVCIMGASFGAYSALQNVVKHPNAYNCAIANAGIYDLPLLFENGDVTELSYGKSYLTLTLGTDQKQLKSYSPVYNVDKIKTPLLLAHGEKDKRAPFEHAERLRGELDKAKKPYQWFVLADESHGFHDPDNQRSYMKSVVKFLNKNLRM